MSTSHTIEVCLWIDGEEEWHDLPAKWVICDQCGGDTKCLPDGMRGYGYTQSEWSEWDDEERDRYFGGFYDVGCSECRATGKVLVVDDDRLDDKTKEAYYNYLEDEAYYDAEREAERRMGC